MLVALLYCINGFLDTSTVRVLEVIPHIILITTDMVLVIAIPAIVYVIDYFHWEIWTIYTLVYFLCSLVLKSLLLCDYTPFGSGFYEGWGCRKKVTFFQFCRIVSCGNYAYPNLQVLVSIRSRFCYLMVGRRTRPA